MEIKNLNDNPEYIEKTLHLIEEAFSYDSENSFKVDFYPLFNKTNFVNCYILINEGEVLAHIGSLKRNIILNSKNFLITMYGGIAVATHAQGKGLFRKLMDFALEKNKLSTFHLLWSDKLDLYEKFDFYPCGTLLTYPQLKDVKKTIFKIEKRDLKNISDEELSEIRTLYNQSVELRIQRDESHWDDLKQITSSVVYLVKDNDKIKNYFIKNKGQDLQEIIHEYGFINEEQLALMQCYGHVWSPIKFNSEHQSIFSTCMKIGNISNFTNFIKIYSQINLDSLDSKKVDFKFESFQQTLSIAEFLQGILGPGRFKELDIPYFNVCGLDSI